MKRVWILALLGILLVGAALWRRHPTVVARPVAVVPKKNPVTTPAPVAPAVKAPVQMGVAPAVAARPADASEKASLVQMTRLLTEFSNPHRRMEDLVAWLKKTNQNPTITRDSNPYTGDMTIVRTQSPLPGTRYFHAQFFSAPGTPAYVQHMSFEFKPGPQAFAQAQAAVQKAGGVNTRPSEKRPNFLRYELGDGYIVWIKKMDREDLGENPFNAYSPDDVGTIRVALELSPHEAGE